MALFEMVWFNRFHAMREIPRQETRLSGLDLVFDKISERNVSRHQCTVKSNYSWLFNNETYTLSWK
jgi:hypothetical protein